MKTVDLTFLGSDPGAVKFGNFINYYSFHGAKERIDNLDPYMFPQTNANEITCLDIGCNTGELSKELHSYLKTIYPSSEIKMLAVDIDPALIQRAQESYEGSEIKFQPCNIMTGEDRESIVKYLESHKKNVFDITFCFSVTMWIHINNGDIGLREFLSFIKNKSKTIIIEPQPWNCYRNAQRRMKKSGSMFPLYETLQIRSNVDKTIEDILTENSHKKIFESPSSSWKRKIQSYIQTVL